MNLFNNILAAGAGQNGNPIGIDMAAIQRAAAAEQGRPFVFGDYAQQGGGGALPAPVTPSQLPASGPMAYATPLSSYDNSIARMMQIDQAPSLAGQPVQAEPRLSYDMAGMGAPAAKKKSGRTFWDTLGDIGDTLAMMDGRAPIFRQRKAAKAFSDWQANPNDQDALERFRRYAPETAWNATRQAQSDNLEQQLGQARLGASQIKTLRDVNSWATEALAGATDEDTYQQALAQVQRRFGALNLPYRNSFPAQYPGREGIRNLILQGMEGDRQLAAMDRADRNAWLREDDEIDNARADRNTDSLIGNREARLGLTRRGQDIASGDRRRAQDIGSADRRLGIATTDQRIREGYSGGGRRTARSTGGSGSASSGAPALPGSSAGARNASGGIVNVRTPEQARALKPGTMFRTPDGKVKVR